MQNRLAQRKFSKLQRHGEIRHTLTYQQERRLARTKRRLSEMLAIKNTPETAIEQRLRKTLLLQTASRVYHGVE